MHYIDRIANADKLNRQELQSLRAANDKLRVQVRLDSDLIMLCCVI